MSPYANLEFTLSSSLTESDQGTLLTLGELLNISNLNPFLTLLLAMLAFFALVYTLFITFVTVLEVRQHFNRKLLAV